MSLIDKKDILNKAKKENLFNDEAKNYKNRKGDAWGLIGAITIWIIFTILYFVKGKDTYHLFSIFFSYLGFNYLGKYFANKEKSDLIISIGGLMVFIGNFVIGFSEIWNF